MSLSAVRSEVVKLMTVVWALFDAGIKEHRRHRAFHQWADEQLRGGAGGLHKLLKPVLQGLEQIVFARDRQHLIEMTEM